MSQFSLGDHRDLDEVVRDIAQLGYIPSFCTACYRLGRTGMDFMDLAKPGEIKHHCDPNALSTFEEYLLDYASEPTRECRGGADRAGAGGDGRESAPYQRGDDRESARRQSRRVRVAVPGDHARDFAAVLLTPGTACADYEYMGRASSTPRLR